MLNLGKWIWINDTGKNTFAEFYSAFTAKEHATVKISCDGDYTLYINGQYLSSNQYGDFEHYKSVDEIDASHLIIKGENHIAITVWHFGKDSQRYKKYNPGLIFEVWEDNTLLLSSGENILSRKSKCYLSHGDRVISSQLGFSYDYDSTKEDNWQLGGGIDLYPSVLAEKECSLISRPNQKLVIGKKIASKKIGNALYDLGKEYVGLLTFKISAKCETKISISFGECLKNGHVKRKIGDRDFSINYVARAGHNDFTHYMLRFACRYLEIDNWQDVDIEEIGLLPQFYPVSNTVALDFSSSAEKEIYQLCLNTLSLCMMEHYVDCPWREQCLYAFDSRNQMLAGYYAFEDKNKDYARSNLLLMGKDKRSDGLLSICYPCGVDLTIPSFSLHFVTAVREYIENTNDKEIINHLDGKINEIIKTFLSNRKDGLVCTFAGANHWNFYDWSDSLDGALFKSDTSHPDSAINLLTIFALDNYEKICLLCGIDFPYKKEREEIARETRKRFFDKNKEVFLFNDGVKPLDLVNSLAILTELVTKDEAEKICKLLINDKLSRSSLSTRCFMYDALLKTDKSYGEFILNDIIKTYEPMIKTGTAWETTVGESDFGDAGSLCHGWSCMPIKYLRELRG